MFKPRACLGTAFVLSLSALDIAPSSACSMTMEASATPIRPERSCPQTRSGFLMRMLITFLACSIFAAPSAMGQSRGELLYTTHCISCHTTEMHWRDNRSASNWPAVKAQVRRWQDVASLAWSDGDILDVSRYLNETIYHFDQTAEPVSSSSRGGNEPASMRIRLALLRRP
jgi:hypothetical protein